MPINDMDKMAEKRGRGRQVQYTPKVIAEIKTRFLQYINATDIPIVAEFAYLNEIPRQTLYELEDLRDTMKRCIDKKESQLERLNLAGEVNTAQAIFSLKQLGWKDKQEIEHSGSIDPVQGMSPDERRKMIAALIEKRSANGD